MKKPFKIDPLVERYFNLIRKNLPYGCNIEYHSECDLSSTGPNKIYVYHSHGSFGVDKSELIRLWREDQIDKLFNNQ